MSEDQCLEDVEDMEEMEEEDAGNDVGLTQSTPEKRARHAITGRGVTLQMLMADGMIQAGEGVLSLEYLGQKFTADLLPSGKIKSNETGQIFGSPSSWAIFCKKLVNPAKKSGCGWASVKYKGRKLDSWKTSWFRQQKPRKPHIPGSQSPISSEDSNLKSEDSKPQSMEPFTDSQTPTEAKQFSLSSPEQTSSGTNRLISPPESSTAKSVGLVDGGVGVLDLTTKPKMFESDSSEKSSVPVMDPGNLCFVGEQEEALNLSMKPSTGTSSSSKKSSTPATVPKVENKGESMEMGPNDKSPIKHSALPARHQIVDMNQLVKCETFGAVNKVQPYTVSMSTNSLLLMDFHCHLTTSEVVGYLGGKWDPTTQHLSVQQAFPCRCRLSDSQNAPIVEEEIRSTMKHLGMSLVGWFHSHPYCLPEPSVRDIECQMSYQLKMKGNKSTYFPCVGIIHSPYNSKSLKTESSIQMYMAMPAQEPSQTDFGVPMCLKYTTKQNHTVSEDLLAEMKKLVEFYRGSPDWISFQHTWQPGITFLDKLKTSIGGKLPEDQSENTGFMDFIQHVLTS